MDGLVVGQVLVVGIGDLNGTIPNAGVTSGADILDNVAGFLNQGDVEVPRVPFDVINFRIG